MMDMQSYLMYELFLARRREVVLEEHRRQSRRARRMEEVGSPLVARLALAVADGLVASGKRLRRRYEPVSAPRVQTQH